MSTTSFHAEVLADSLAPNKVRITTMLLTYPRFIHAEMMTHRDFSRNAASSRAIPVKKKLDRVLNFPVEPVEWGLNKPGMQSTEVLTPENQELAKNLWHTARLVVLHEAEKMDKLKVHKQVTNRMLEPWDWMTTIYTSTRWGNFDHLRIHPAADPNAQKIARLRKEAYDASTPKLLEPGEWHLPYVSDAERHEWLDGGGDVVWAGTVLKGYALLKRLSAARCARLSYLNHDKTNPSIKDDLTLFDRLTSRENPTQDPGHWTPTEHQATPIDGIEFWVCDNETSCGFCHSMIGYGERCAYLAWVPGGGTQVCKRCALGHVTSGNLHGWRQFRKEFEHEYLG